MLSDWYFCSSVGLDPRQTSVFLTMMDVIRNTQDPRLLYLTYGELVKSNVWMQVYALPQVLHRQRTTVEQDVLRAAREYLDNMIERVPVEGQRLLLAQLFTARTSRADFMQRLEQLAAALVEDDETEREASDKPYLDLETFLPETLFAAYLFDISTADDARTGSRIADQLAKGELPSLQRFLELAIENQFGRLVLRLGLRLNARLLPDFNTEALHETLWELEGIVPELEPDLLQTLINIYFSDHQTAETATTQAERMLRDVQSMQHYRALLQARASDEGDHRKTPDLMADSRVGDVLLRLGLATRVEEEKRALPLVLWQVLLCETAAELAPELSARHLADLWATPGGETSQAVLLMDMNQETSRDTFYQWRDQLNTLAKLHDAFIRVHSEHHDRRMEVDGPSRWAFFSPWVPLGPKPFGKGGDRYPGAQSSVLLIRLMSAGFTAANLLPRLADGPERSACAALVLHTKNVIDYQYGRWLRNYATSNPTNRQLSLRMTGFMLFSNEHIKLLFQSPAVPTEVFLDQRRQFTGERSPSRHIHEFLRVALPEALVSIIADIYNNVTGQVGAGRWLPLIPEVYRYLREADNRVPYPQRELGALIYRFVGPEATALDLGAFDWRKRVDQYKGKIRQRQLLLTQALPVADWLDFEPVLAEAEKKAERGPSLVRTIEQLTALDNERDSLDPDEYAALHERWLADWRSSMASIHQNYELDRFTRLRLLELLDCPLLADSPEDQTLIAYLLLEFGSAHEIDRLVKRIFWGGAQADSSAELAPSTYARHQVRMEILQYLVQQVKNPAPSDDEDVRTPHTIMRRLNRESYIRGFVRRVALSATHMPENDQAAQLVRQLIDLGDALLESRRKARERQVQAEIRRRSHRENLYLTEIPEAPVEDWQITRATIDPNQSTATLHYTDIDVGACTNLFSAENKAVLDFLHGSDTDPVTVVAGVLRRVRSRDNERPYTYEFYFGLQYPARGSFDQAVFTPSGFLALEIKRTGRMRWTATGKRPRPLFGEHRPGDLIQGPDILEFHDRANDMRRIQFKAPFKDHDRQYERRFWDADLSRRFAPYFRTEGAKATKDDTLAYLASENYEHPYEYAFEDLLVSSEAFGQGNERVYVLTLVEMRDPDLLTGNSMWLFTVRPGFNVLLSGGDFTEDLLEEIEDAITETDDLTGLLVVAQPQVQDDGQVRLAGASALPEAEAAQENGLEAFFPDLETPIDRRNWRWRDLFEGTGDDDTASWPVAVRDPESQTWVYPIPEGYLPRSFPQRIEVDFRDSAPPGSATECEMQYPLWRNWSSYTRPFVVQAAAPPQYSIDPQGSDTDFFYMWSTLRRGHRVQLGRVIGMVRPGSDGSVMGLTIEGLGINVQLDSLSLMPQKLSERPYFNTRFPRVVEVTRAKNWKPIGPVQVTRDSDIVHVEGSCEGVLLSMPVDVKSSQRCEVLWRSAEGTQRGAINITNLAALGSTFRPGCRISGTVQDGQTRLKAWSRLIFGRALWQRPQPFEEARVPERLAYIGMMSYEGRQRHIARGYAGQLLLLPDDFPGAQHLADIRQENGGWQINGGLKPDTRVTYREPKYEQTDQGKLRVVVTANLDNDEHGLVGYSSQPITGSRLQLEEITCTLEDRDDDYVTLQRTLKVVSRGVEKVARPTGTSNRTTKQKEKVDQRARYEPALNRYLAEPEDLDARIQGDVAVLDELHVPQDPEGRRWLKQAPLFESDTWIIGNSYAPQAKVRLLQLNDGRVVASTRATLPYDIRRFYDEIGTALNRNVNLDEYLYYVGEEPMPAPMPEQGVLFDPTATGTGEAAQIVTGHRFEWGYGKTLLVPESRLLFDGEPFDSGQMLLFYGDYISGIEFVATESQAPAGGEEAPAAQELSINIHNYNLSFSQGRRLFMQRREFRIIHLVHLLVSGGDLLVRHVEAFNEENIRQINTNFRRVRGFARLSAESADRLKQRLTDEDEGREIVINGRLNEQEYLFSSGRNIEFDHVYLGFEEDKGAVPLQDGELVFIDGGPIRLLPNDQAVLLRPPAVLERDDVSRSLFKNLLILRRQFSVREDILLRVYQEDPNYFQRRLLVRLTRREKKVNASMVHNIPPRKPRAIASSGQQMVILAAWIRKHEGRRPEDLSIELELRPGVTVRLGNNPACTVESYPDNIERGAVVRVEILDRSQGHIRVRIVLASFSDSHYVPELGRLAVALPKNSLLERRQGNDNSGGKSDNFWNNLFGFTIGGLPNIVAAPATYDFGTKSWRKPNANDFVRLMQSPHPKIVHLQRDGNQYRIAARMQDSTAGSLHVDEDGELTVNANGSKGSHPLRWRYQTFAHESVKQVRERMKNETWMYHDERSGHWLEGEDTTQHEHLGKHNALSGPLFFQREKKFLKLRYDDNRFLQFGFPVAELIGRLAREGRKTYITCTVAGVSKEGGVWVELAPGRLCEIPQEIVIWKTSISEKPLTNFAWSLFAPGDRLSLQLVQGNVLEIDRLAFRNWIPGPRGAFGRGRTLLPVVSFDPVQGALNLGHGEYTLTLPVKQFDYEGAVMLNHDNQLERVESLRRGDVVLLGLDEQDQVMVHGLPGWKAEADINYDWSRDPLGLTSQRKDFVRRETERLREVIDAVGGALPVTVEAAIEKDSVIYFSRYRQDRVAEIRPGEIAMVRVMGTLDDDNTVILRAGGRLLCLPFAQIIPGLPKEHYGRAAEFLIESRQYLWLRADETGNHRLGLTDESQRREFSVRARGLIKDEGGQPLGLLCGSTASLRLYWLPVQWLSWTELSAEEIERLFVKSHLAFLVTHHNNSISLRHLAQARQLFDKLRVGDEVQVRVVEIGEQITIGQEKGWQYLMQIGPSRLLLRCQALSPDLDTDTDIAVEVVQRTDAQGRPDVLVVPLGERRYRLDLPAWMLDSELDTPTMAVERYNTWHDAAPETITHSIDTLLAGGYDDELDKLLCYAHAHLKAGATDIELQVQVASRWYRQSIQAPEMDLALAIMALNIFFEYGTRKKDDAALLAAFPRSDAGELNEFRKHWLDRANSLFANLGRRALRSMHVEQLATYFADLSGSEADYGEDTLYTRLDYVSKYLLKPELDRSELNLIRQFYHVTQLRSTRLRLIGKGMAMATGQDVTFDSIEEEKAPVITRLIALYATVHMNATSQVRVNQRHHIEQLNTLLKRIQSEVGVQNVVLLSPLPQLMSE